MRRARSANRQDGGPENSPCNESDIGSSLKQWATSLY